MSATNLESRVRDLFARQATAMTTPDVQPDDVRVVIGEPGHGRRPRGLLLVGAAAAAVLVLGGVALANRSADSDAAGAPTDGSAATFHYSTPQVQLAASSIAVEAGGRTFVPPPDLEVNSDFGDPSHYTTLELSWDADGTPMKVNLYFASDGTDWWASEIRTYDGSSDPKWIETNGEYFRTPLGSAYHGDIDISSLHIHGLTLEAFRTPAACSNTDAATPLAVVANYGAIDVEYFAGGGFGWTATLTDTATCQPVATDNVSVSIVSGDPGVASVNTDMDVSSSPIGTIRVDLSLVGPGTTTVHLSVHDKTTGALIGQVDIPVNVRPAS